MIGSSEIQNSEIDVTQAKRKLRAQVISKRDAMCENDRIAKSNEACNRLFSLARQFAESPALSNQNNSHTPISTTQSADPCDNRTANPFTVAVYAGMGSELCLDAFIAAAYGAGWRVAFPCMNPKGSTPRMCMRHVSREAWLAHMVPFIEKPLVRFDIKCTTLADFPVICPQDINFVAAPLVAFDGQGFRLGYGGGNYDEYLDLLDPRALVAGVAFNEQCVSEVPREPHDKMLNTIVCA